MNTNIIRQYRRIHNWENFFIDSAVYSVGQSAGIVHLHWGRRRRGDCRLYAKIVQRPAGCAGGGSGAAALYEAADAQSSHMDISGRLYASV